MSSREAGMPQPSAKPPLRWTSWLLIVLVVGAITAAVTYAVIWYITYCGECEAVLRETV